MKLILIAALMAILASSYKITWSCAVCADQALGKVCYTLNGDPFGNNSIIGLNASITQCSFQQTGFIFPMLYQFKSCGEGSCYIGVSTSTSFSSVCTNSKTYQELKAVKDLSKVYRMYKKDESASYDWCDGFIDEESGVSTIAIVGIVIGAIVVVGGIVGVVIYFRRKKIVQDNYQDIQN